MAAFLYLIPSFVWRNEPGHFSTEDWPLRLSCSNSVKRVEDRDFSKCWSVVVSWASSPVMKAYRRKELDCWFGFHLFSVVFEIKLSETLNPCVPVCFIFYPKTHTVMHPNVCLYRHTHFKERKMNEALHTHTHSHSLKHTHTKGHENGWIPG